MISVLVLLFKFWLGRPSLSWNSWKLTKAKQTWDFILVDCFQRYQTGDELKPSIQSIKSSKSTKKSKKQIPLKNICAWEENFNSVFLVQRVGVETADHLCFRTSAWTDCHSLFQRGAWFTPRQHLEASDQVWRSETRQLLRLSTNYERAHFKRTDEWRQSATIIYYFKLPKNKREEE